MLDNLIIHKHSQEINRNLTLFQKRGIIPLVLCHSKEKKQLIKNVNLYGRIVDIAWKKACIPARRICSARLG